MEPLFSQVSTAEGAPNIHPVDTTAANIAMCDLAANIGDLVPGYVDVKDLDAAAAKAIAVYEAWRSPGLAHSMTFLKFAGFFAAFAGGVLVVLTWWHLVAIC